MTTLNKKESFNHFEDILIGFMKGKALLLAFKLKILDLPLEQTYSLKEIASTIAANNEKALQKLLSALCGMSIFAFDGEKYQRNDINIPLFPFFLSEEIELRTANDLADQIQNNADLIEKLPTKKDWQLYMQAMADISEVCAQEIVNAIDIDKAKTLCDVGSGPGTYAQLFAKSNPKLKVTLFDVEPSLDEAKANLQNSPVFEQLNFTEGSVTDSDWHGPYDIIFLSHVIHLFQAPDVLKIFQTALKNLAPNGRLIVRDLFLDDKQIKPELGPLLSLCVWNNGGAYSALETKDLLIKAGFKKVNRTHLAAELKLPQVAGGLLEAT